jgi:hypothetical protein
VSSFLRILRIAVITIGDVTLLRSSALG